MGGRTISRAGVCRRSGFAGVCANGALAPGSLCWTGRPAHRRPAISASGETGAQATLCEGLGEPEARSWPSTLSQLCPGPGRCPCHPGTWILASWDRTPRTRYPVRGHVRTCLTHPKLPWPHRAQPRRHQASVPPRAKLASRTLNLEPGQERAVKRGASGLV